MINREQWLVDRMQGIGGSDAAAALGLSHWKQPLKLYLEKRGEIPAIEDNESMRWGRILEPVVRQEYAERSGRTVRVPSELMHHPRHPFVIGTPDGVTDCGRLLEVKTARSADGWGEPGTDAIPPDYVLQVQHYLMLTGLVVADVAVLIGGSDFRIYELTADQELHEMLIEGEEAFWNCVTSGTPPDPDFESPGAMDVIRKLYPGTNGQRMIADTPLENWYYVFQQSSDRAKRYGDAADAAKAHLAYEMGEAAMLAFHDGKALRRKKTTRKGFVVEPTTYIDMRVVNDSGE